jgi:carbon-monoxide dehydrogenase medium subunit
MYPRQFDYVAPSNLDDALAALDANPGAKVLAGGMSLLPMMKLRLLSPELVVDIGRIDGLGDITDNGDSISVGALVTHGDVAASGVVQAHGSALATAASWTGDRQVRNRGTCCGSMVHADVAADQPVAALALGATMVAASSRGSREIAVADFFVDTLMSALAPNEVLVEMRIPKVDAGTGSAYDKLGRRGGHTDYAVAGVAASVTRSNGSISAATVAVTGVGNKPVLAGAVMDALVGSDGSDSAVDAAAAHATDGIDVLEDLYGSVDYKSHLARVFTARAVKAALAAAG